MESLPSVEMLNAAHAFPCSYVFKVMGLRADDFVARTLAAVEAETGVAPTYTTRETPAGRHVSITLDLHMQSAEQVHAVYRRLQTLQGLVLLL